MLPTPRPSSARTRASPLARCSCASAASTPTCWPRCCPRWACCTRRAGRSPSASWARALSTPPSPRRARPWACPSPGTPTCGATARTASPRASHPPPARPRRGGRRKSCPAGCEAASPRRARATSGRTASRRRPAAFPRATTPRRKPRPRTQSSNSWASGRACGHGAGRRSRRRASGTARARAPTPRAWCPSRVTWSPSSRISSSSTAGAQTWASTTISTPSRSCTRSGCTGRDSRTRRCARATSGSRLWWRPSRCCRRGRCPDGSSSSAPCPLPSPSWAPWSPPTPWRGTGRRPTTGRTGRTTWCSSSWAPLR
mmetsp:Transcript_199/g.566  ORF Transcript_199/g.566 Transcript_199/m.566 type:complete len:314 (-) Transcript_199:995-1936(-)